MKDKERTSDALNENVVPFKRHAPIIEPNPDWDEKDTDWLWGLSTGTVFLVSQPVTKDQYGRVIKNPVLLEFHVIDKMDDPNKFKRCVRLLTNMNADHFQWMISSDFSNQFTLHKVVIRGEDLP